MHLPAGDEVDGGDQHRCGVEPAHADRHADDGERPGHAQQHHSLAPSRASTITAVYVPAMPTRIIEWSRRRRKRDAGGGPSGGVVDPARRQHRRDAQPVDENRRTVAGTGRPHGEQHGEREGDGHGPAVQRAAQDGRGAPSEPGRNFVEDIGRRGGASSIVARSDIEPVKQRSRSDAAQLDRAVVSIGVAYGWPLTVTSSTPLTAATLSTSAGSSAQRR